MEKIAVTRVTIREPPAGNSRSLRVSRLTAIIFPLLPSLPVKNFMRCNRTIYQAIYVANKQQGGSVFTKHTGAEEVQNALAAENDADQKNEKEEKA